MIVHENRLPADDSHEISWLICYFWKSSKIGNCRLLQIIGGALWVFILIGLMIGLNPRLLNVNWIISFAKSSFIYADHCLRPV